MFPKTMAREHKIFWRFILSYIVILGIPLLIGSFFYREVVILMELDAKNANQSLLIQVRDVLDRRFEEIDSIAKQIAMMPEVNTLLNSGPIETASPEFYKVWNVWNDMPNHTLTNTFINSVYVFFRNANIVVSYRSAFINKPIFYDRSLKHPEFDFQEWQELLWMKPHNSLYLPATAFTINDRKRNVVPYLQSIPVGMLNNPKGVIMILIEEKEIQNLLRKINIGNNGFVYVTNEKEDIITYILGNSSVIHPSEIAETYIREGYMRFKDDRMLISRVVSRYNGWSYISVVSRDLVMARVNYAKQVGLAIIAVSLFMGISMACFLAYRNTKPIKDIVSMVKKLKPERMEKNDLKYTDDYNYLQDSILNMAQTNRQLKDEFDKHLPELRISFLSRLLNGEFTSQDEIYNYCAHIGLEIKGQNYTVVALRIDGFDDLADLRRLKHLELIKTYIKSEFEKLENTRVYCLDVSLIKVAALMISDDVDEKSNANVIKNIIDGIYLDIKNTFDKDLFFAVGGTYEDTLSIVSSFNEAKQALEYKGHNQKNVAMWFSEMPQRGEDCYYPIDLELRLISCVKAGNVEEMKRIIGTVYIENFVKRQLSSEMIEQLVFLMKGTILRELGYMRSDGHINEILKKTETVMCSDEIFRVIQEAHCLVCQLVNDSKRNDKLDLKNKVIEYIDQFFMQQNLCIYKMAEQFKVSEAYMYCFFKENMGITFSDYLEAKRIHCACALLTSADLPIKEVANNSGYGNDHTFRRAFKKVIGVTPSEYKNANSANH